MSLLADLGRALGQLGDRRFLGALVKAVATTVAALALVFWLVVLGLGWLLTRTATEPGPPAAREARGA